MSVFIEYYCYKGKMLNMKFKFGKPAFHIANNPIVEKTNI